MPPPIAEPTPPAGLARHWPSATVPFTRARSPTTAATSRVIGHLADTDRIVPHREGDDGSALPGNRATGSRPRSRRAKPVGHRLALLRTAAARDPISN